MGKCQRTNSDNLDVNKLDVLCPHHVESSMSPVSCSVMSNRARNHRPSWQAAIGPCCWIPTVFLSLVLVHVLDPGQAPFWARSVTTASSAPAPANPPANPATRRQIALLYDIVRDATILAPIFQGKAVLSPNVFTDDRAVSTGDTDATSDDQCAVEVRDPNSTFIDFLRTIPNFRREMEVFVSEHLSVPDGTVVKREGDTLTLELPPNRKTPRGNIHPESSLTPDEFRLLNRYVDHDNLKYLQGKKIPIPKALPSNPTVKDLKYFRSIGPAVTREITAGAELTSGRTIRMRIKDNTIEFVEGGPQIGSAKIAAIEFRKIHASLDALKEQGIVRVYTKAPWMPLLSDEYFVSDIGYLLPRMQMQHS